MVFIFGEGVLVPYILILAHKNKNLMKGGLGCGFPALVSS